MGKKISLIILAICIVFRWLLVAALAFDRFWETWFYIIMLLMFVDIASAVASIISFLIFLIIGK